MSKILLSPQEVCRVMTDYLGAVKLAFGEAAMDRTELTYSREIFHLRSHNHSAGALSLPYKPKEIEAMTAKLRKKEE